MLYSACVQENLELVDTLLNLGANPTCYYVGKKGPLQIAAKKGNIKLLERLLQAGVDINNDRKGTALYCASAKGNIDIIDYLIDRGANVDQYMQSINCAGTALMIACERKQVDAGANVNIINTYTRTAFIHACIGGSTEIIDRLIIHGANINDPECQQTPLFVASYHGNIEIVRKLINLGVNVDQQKNLFNMTPLMAAVVNCHTEIVELLLKENADTMLIDTSGNDVYNMRKYAKHGEKSLKIMKSLLDHRMTKLINKM